MTPRSAARRRPEPTEPASIPEVPVPLSQVPEHQRAAYEIELIDNPEEFRKVLSTEDFFSMIQSFPAAWWGERLSMYLYRHEDDGGLMVKNAQGEGKYIKPVIRRPIDRDWVASQHGGGKYCLWLKLDSKETLRKHTFLIDGAPKVTPGQVVEVDGKPVPIGTQTVLPPSNAGSDLSAVIQASSDANKQNMEILAEGSKAAIALVRDQASAATRPDSGTSVIEKLLPMLLEKLLTQPAPPDPLEMLVKAKTLFATTNPAPEVEPKDPPLVEAMDLVEKMSGKSFAEILRGKTGSQPEPYGWVAPLASVAQQLIAQFPTIMEQARIARDLEFRRQIWLRTTQPGVQIPQDLLPPAAPAAPANAHTRQPAQPFAPPANGQPMQPAAPDPAQLVGAIVNEICAWFDKRHAQGYQCAAMIDGLHGEHIEALGLEQLLVNEEQVKQLVAGNPLLATRSNDARWSDFEHDFIAYMQDRWGADEGEEEDSEPPRPINGVAANKPQPVA